MMDGVADPSLTILAMEMKWDTAAGTATSAGVRMAMFWLDPSLLSMLAPLAEELGSRCFACSSRTTPTSAPTTITAG